MGEYESLRKDIELVALSVAGYTGAVNRHGEAVDDQLAMLWQDNAELRDEIHAVSNRLENLTRAVVASPAEVAAKIVNDANNGTLREVFVCRTNPGCNLSDPHIHHSDGAVIRVQSAEEADTVISEQERVRRLYPHAFGDDVA